LRIKFVNGLVGYYNFRRVQHKVSETLPLIVICVKHAVHESGYLA